MNWFPLIAGDVSFLRLLLYNRPAMSFQDILTDDGFLHRTFQMSAVAHGYVNDKTEGLLAFQGIAHLSTPAELRVQLVLMTVQGFLTLCIIQNEDLY
jgi:hypothetical protein